MATKDLRHDRIDLKDFQVEVWEDTTKNYMTLYVSGDETHYIDISPDDADILSAMLRSAANRVRVRAEGAP